jgi:Rps23 Pro-64 3,4-dihydroxylase Tpa1-like proline 4-hydroxylase
MTLCVLVLADALLCHDDELEGRRIAFILYLVPSWDRDLGGTLDLYDTDGKMDVDHVQIATSNSKHLPQDNHSDI